MCLSPKPCVSQGCDQLMLEITIKVANFRPFLYSMSNDAKIVMMVS